MTPRIPIVFLYAMCIGYLLAPSFAELDGMNRSDPGQYASNSLDADDITFIPGGNPECETFISGDSEESTHSNTIITENVTIELRPENYTISSDQNGYDMIIMENFSYLSSPGDPVLPLKRYNVLIPPEAQLSSISLHIISFDAQVLDGSFDIIPASPWMANSTRVEWGPGKVIREGKNIPVYGNDSDYPSEFVRLFPAAQMRKWKFVPVEFVPFQYNPLTGKLKLIKYAKINISYSRAEYAQAVGSDLLEDTVMDDRAAEIFSNYQEMKGSYATARTVSWPGPSALGYVIITTSDIKSNSNKLNAFIDHKESLGYEVRVITENDFGALAGEYPNRKAEKIRQWLKNNYITLGIKYVLLIGNPSTYESYTGEGDIPMKMCWPNRINGLPTDSTPTDAFYSDLSGDWDLDGDGLYGELDEDYGPAGGVDFAPEVIAGRIPVYNADYASLDRILQKIIDYESDSSRGWRKSALMPMSFLTQYFDGAVLGEKVKDDLFTPNGYSYWRIYQQGSGKCGTHSSYPSDQDLRADSGTRDRWAANPYGIVCWVGHGGDVVAQVGWSSALPYYDCVDGWFFQSDYCSHLDDDHPSFTFQCSCNNGYPETTNNLQYSILRQGGITTVASTRVSWFGGETYDTIPGYNSNSGIAYEYIKRLVQQLPGGDALAEVKVSNPLPMGNGWLQNFYDFNIYGDPSLGINTGSFAFVDEFDQLDQTVWNSFGSPQPQALESAEGRSGVLDNKGDSWCDSGIVSKEAISFPNGFEMRSDMFLRVTNPLGCWAGQWFGLTTPNTPSGTEPCPTEDYQKGIYFGIEYAGEGCWGTPLEKRQHAYLMGGFLTENGGWESIGEYVAGDDYINEWHEFLISVGADRYVKFYIDKVLIHSSVNKISRDVLNEKKPILGGRSSGSAGKAYSDYIRIIGGGNSVIHYPDFTDTADSNGWRSWLVLQNPTDAPANINLDIRSRTGDQLYSGNQVIAPYGAAAIRPRNLIGSDCAGSVVVTSGQLIMGTCQISRNSNEMCMSYNALDQGSRVLHYPDFTDTADPESWRSWLVLQNPADTGANITLDIRSRAGDLLYSGSQAIPAHGVAAIRPRSLVGYDCAGSVRVTSDLPIMGTCQITRNKNVMCMSYTAFIASSADQLPSA